MAFFLPVSARFFCRNISEEIFSKDQIDRLIIVIIIVNYLCYNIVLISGEYYPKIFLQYLWTYIFLFS